MAQRLYGLEDEEEGPSVLAGGRDEEERERDGQEGPTKRQALAERSVDRARGGTF